MQNLIKKPRGQPILLTYRHACKSINITNMKTKTFIRNTTITALFLLVAACGGGSSSSGSDASATSSWLGKWGVNGVALNICPNNRAVVSGEVNLSQNAAQINGNYLITITCVKTPTPQVRNISGTLSSTSIAKKTLVLVDNEGDIFTFSDTSGHVSLKIDDPDAGNILTIIALRR